MIVIRAIALDLKKTIMFYALVVFEYGYIKYTVDIQKQISMIVVMVIFIHNIGSKYNTKILFLNFILIFDF